ncbi:hypothetical protein [Pyxidicoccus xibeiensis]|uniref:hypothetical protein n=1 Tax=Pyxidicoccus xibeiensis TaxID=2906759 RepID=UPI0020A74E0A|nr:hypothetical protein [Pyxidicoccus xibeiensis]MCP3141698.1 hypothetical protein [Pyxidicoccus xibeiensis]
MSERTRPRGGGPVEGQSTLEDLRRQLEGRLELLEAMLPRYRSLSDALKGRRWQRRLRERASFVEEVLARDAACLEAMERATRRAELESWPKDSPVLKTVQQVRKCREVLEARVHERLASLTVVSGAASLELELRQLEALVRTPVSFALEPGESFSQLVGYSGRTLQTLLGIAVPLVAVGLPIALLVSTLTLGLTLGLAGPLFLGLMLAVVGLVAALVGLRPGALWLTPARLVWLPSSGEPVAVRLDALPEGGVRFVRGRRGLRVEGDRSVHLPWLGWKRAARLRVWLEMLRHPKLRERSALVAEPVEWVCFPALHRREDGTWFEGQAVLSRRMLYFLPGPEAGAALLRSATGKELDSRVSLPWVLDMLRWQPESDVDVYLLRAVKASRGAAWPAGLARLSQETFLAHELHISYGREVLTGRVGWGDVAAAERILASWR